MVSQAVSDEDTDSQEKKSIWCGEGQQHNRTGGKVEMYRVPEDSFQSIFPS